MKGEGKVQGEVQNKWQIKEQCKCHCKVVKGRIERNRIARSWVHSNDGATRYVSLLVSFFTLCYFLDLKNTNRVWDAVIQNFKELQL